MGLDPQNVPIALNKGLDTKDDPKQLQPGKMLALSNCSFKSPNQLSKRDGFTGLPRSILGGGTVSSGIGVSSFQNELVSLDGTNLYSYSPDAAAQIEKGQLTPVTLSVQPISRTNDQLICPDSAYHAATGLQCFVWLDQTTGQGRYSILDSTTGAQIVSSGAIVPPPNSITTIKVLQIGVYFVIIFYCNQSSVNKLQYVAINTATPGSVGSPVTIASDFYTSGGSWDATITAGAIYVSYSQGTNGDGIGFYSISSTLVLSSQYVVVAGSGGVGTGTVGGMSLVGDGAGHLWCFYTFLSSSLTVQSLYGLIVNTALNATTLTATLISTPTNPASTSLITYNIVSQVVGTTATIYWEQTQAYPSGGNATSNAIWMNTLTLSGTAGSASVFMYRMGLASKLFVYNGTKYVLGVYGGDYIKQTSLFLPASLQSIQSTYFLINLSGSPLIVAKLAPASSGQYYTTGLLPEVVSLNSTTFEIPYLIKDDLSSTSGFTPPGGTPIAAGVFFKTGVQSSQFNFQLALPMPKLEIGENLNFASGQMWMYDGATICEQGFHIYPENLSDLINASAGGIGQGASTAATNQIQYCAIFEWQDNQGQLQQSNPSPVLTVNLTPEAGITPTTFVATTGANSVNMTSVGSFSAAIIIGQVISGTGIQSGTYIVSYNSSTNVMVISQPATASNSGITVTTYDVSTITVLVPTLTATLKPNVSIVLYRTENNETIFYRVSSLTNLTYNNTGAQYVSFTDTLPDAVIVGNEQLYTTGGTVGNINPPAVSAMCPFVQRSCYLSPENPFQVGFSQQIIDGVPVQFNSLEFVANVDQRIGKCTAIAPMDTNLIILGPFKKYYMSGSGPSPNGQNNDFTDPAPIAGVSGCSNPDAVLELPVGIIYQDSQKGFWLLDRSLQEHYIGADVEQYNSQTVTSAQLVPNATKAMFTLGNGVNLIYDYFVGQWETDPFPAAVFDSATFENDIVYIQANGLILQQTPGVFTDNSALIPISLTTGWMSFAGVQGYQRVWELIILGTYKSPHTLTVNISTDFSTSPTTTRVIPVLSDPGLYEFRVRLNVGKCTAIQVQISESQTGTFGEGFSLSSLSFRVGVKKGQNKLPASQSY